VGEGSYIAAVQWHPEFHRPGEPGHFDDTAMLKDFLAACQAVREGAT
jgi:putative glutamine amidotransferase